MVAAHSAGLVSERSIPDTGDELFEARFLWPQEWEQVHTDTGPWMDRPTFPGATLTFATTISLPLLVCALDATHREINV